MRFSAFGLAFVLAVLAPISAFAQAAQAGSISLLNGQAQATGLSTPAHALAKGDPVYGGEKLLKSFLEIIPRGALGRPDELVGPCVFLASDASPIIEYTKEVVYVNDYELAILKADELILKNLGNEKITPFIQKLDLEMAAGLLAQTQYPDTNIEAYQALYDSWAAELRTRISPVLEAEKNLGLVNQYLFTELKFAGNEQFGDNPENCYLNRVVDRRTGNPISLCAIYLFLARRLKLPIAGIGLPGHFICRHQSSAAEIFIDAFNGGKFLSKADCVQYLAHANYSLRDDCLAPVSSRRMLLRICGNLHQTYLQLQRTEETTRIQRYLVALAR